MVDLEKLKNIAKETVSRDDVKYLINKDVLKMSAYVLLNWAEHRGEEKNPAKALFEVDRAQSTSKYNTLAVARSL